MAKRTVVLTFDCPSSVSYSSLRAYIIKAIATWGGQYHPDDPLFYGIKNIKLFFQNAKDTSVLALPSKEPTP